MNAPIIRLGVIGAGARACVLTHILPVANQIRLAKIFDPDPAACRRWLAETHSSEAEICTDYMQITRDPSIDWVMVFSPNYLHKEHIIDAFSHDKNVFAEKPLATTLEDCETIYNAFRKSKRHFATGFVLRYAPLYRKVKELLDQGEIGKIIAVEANEHITPYHGAHIMSNWRRFSEQSGSHILEKCCHDLDLLNWFIHSLPSQVASFGGLNFFRPENRDLKTRYINHETNKGYFDCDEKHEPCAFTSEKTIVDNQVAIIEYRNQVRATFTATLSNIIPERRMYFSGSEGTLIVDLKSGKIRVRHLREDAERQFDISGDGHGGGDAVIGRELAELMLHGGNFPSSGNEGLESAVTALAIEAARCQNKIIDLEPIWKKLNR